jgi:predicted O-methyltransferase YrrM
MVPPALAAVPELREVTSFLDVGTGVGLLAVSAAAVWPTATIVGIDVWEPSLARARTHVAQAGLADRITLRTQDVADLDDVGRYDCAWVPTFFLSEAGLEAALPRIVRALRPGGWVALGRFVAAADPLAEALNRLRIVRGGGFVLEADQAAKLLDQVGCEGVRVVPPAGPAPLELVIGQRPA